MPDTDTQQQADPKQAAQQQEQSEGKTDNSSNSPRAWKRRIDRCKKVRKELIDAWSWNVDYRRGKPFDQESDDDRVNVNLDWGYTKAKHAQLFSQVPQVYLTPKQPMFGPAAAVFQKELNEKLTDGGLGPACNEATLDTINASGFGVALVDYQARTEKKQVPVQDISKFPPQIQMELLKSGRVQMEEVDFPVNKQFRVRRFSPADFLWPTEFTGSDFDQADWVGRSGYMLWDEAQIQFGLKDEEKEVILGSKNKPENLRQGGVGGDTESMGLQEDVVEYDEIYYWSYRFDSKEKYFKRINRIVFVKGKEKPVIHEPWKGQKFLPEMKKYVGACKFPIRVLTLTYISDDAIPPSDTAIIRPQVDEMIRSRTDIVRQRAFSKPLRWFNTNLLDPEVADNFQRGVQDAALPINGVGDKALGEIARAQYPRENWDFDRVIKGDIDQQIGVSPNNLGSFTTGRRTAAEANVAASGFQTRIGYERAQVAAFVTGIGEVMAGLLALYSDFELPSLNEQDVQRLGTWDRQHISQEYAYNIRPDSTVLLDSQQRVDKLMKVLNLVGKSGFVNPKPIIGEVVELHGVDPAGVVVDPQPPTEKPSISYRFTGAADLANPLVIALLMKAGEAPSPDELNAAKMLLEAVSKPVTPPPPPGAGGPGGPKPPQQGPPKAPPNVGDAHPGWGGMPKVIKRSQDI